MLIEASSIASAWSKAFQSVYRANTISPLTVTVSGFRGEAPDDESIRGRVDAILDRRPGTWHVATTANTIFPTSMWRPGVDRDVLYTRYTTLYEERLRRVRANQLGTYFLRLIDYGPNHLNQLETVIETWKVGVRRRSALIASVFDPHKDHRATRQRGFPCMHQVCFTPEADDGLAITGFYAKQDIFDRGYGNYVGLARLGRFMAEGFGLTLSRVTCVAAQAGLTGRFRKGELQSLAEELE